MIWKFTTEATENKIERRRESDMGENRAIETKIRLKSMSCKQFWKREMHVCTYSFRL